MEKNFNDFYEIRIERVGRVQYWTVYHKNIQSLIFYQINVNVKNSYTRIFFGIEYTVGPKINILKYCKPVKRQGENDTATAALLLHCTAYSYILCTVFEDTYFEQCAENSKGLHP